jgi:hypothetical protein
VDKALEGYREREFTSVLIALPEVMVVLAHHPPKERACEKHG